MTTPSLRQFYYVRTGNRTSPPHIYIPSLMPREQRVTVGSGQRRTAKLVVAIRLGYDTVVVPCSTSKYDGFVPPKVYLDDAGKPHKGMCGAEYRDIVASHIFSGATRGVQPGVETRSSRAVLVHDGDPTHRCKLFKDYAAAHQLGVEAMPPRSPDLSPLDSGFFGAVRNRWERQVKAQQLGWTQAVLRFIEVLRSEDPAPFINQMPARLKACKSVNGWHIEQELRRSKRG